MSFQTSYFEHPDYLCVKVSGYWTEPATRGLIDEVRAEAGLRGRRRLLFDLQELSPPRSEMTRFGSGEYLAKVLPPPHKVAAFSKPELFTKFGETVAVNRGAHFAVFGDEESALRWLLP